MNDLRHYAGELEQMQSLPLEIKIRMTKMRIQQWVYAFSGEAYISFSGGKDSTVLLNIAREVFPNLPAVFCDTGLEYPEIREFVKRFENVVWLKPQMNFRQVIQKYGYPLISKSVANTLRGGHEPGSYRWKKLHGEVFLKNGKPSKFNCVKWQFLLDAPFKVSEQCCDVMKKRPFHKYQKETGQMPIVATMADESMMRKNSWMKYGCNAFDRASGPQSRPMSFWTERDVLEYLIKYDVPYASVYGDIIGLMPDGTIIPKVIPISQYEPGVTVPPFHPNCRGTTAPAIDPKYAGERAARNADGDVYYVPANMKYADWVQTFVNGGSKAGLTVATGAGVAKTLRDYNTEFGKKFGKDHYDQIRDRVDACQSPDLQAAWDKYEIQIKVAKANHQGGAYCQGNSIYVNIDADGKGRSWSAPYATTFHESGHAIDGLAAQLGTPNGQWHFSSTYKGGAFPQTIKDEVNDWVDRVLADMKAHKDDFPYWVQKGWMSQNTADFYIKYGGFKVKKSYAYAAVQAEVKALTPLQYGDLSDILEGATRGKIRCGIGHGGGSYWTTRTYNGIDWGLGTEAFAEMTSATMTSPESLATIKKYLPKSYAMYEDMLKVIANQP